MGNTITERSGEIKESELKKHIIDWAVNRFDEGLGTETRYTKSLVKRACCTNQDSINIAFPDVTLSETSLLQDPNLIYYSVLNIPIFDESNPKTLGKCIFENNKLYDTISKENNFIVSNSNCESLYTN